MSAAILIRLIGSLFEHLVTNSAPIQATPWPREIEVLGTEMRALSIEQEESLPREIRENLEEMNPTADSPSVFNRTQAISLLQATLRRNRASFNPRLMRLRLARMRDKADASDDEEEDNH